ncbi:TonB-dependent receptor [Kordiimonas gwangyangensis]|uniref:TonB-dependent receptor n=1 Tax=Kordiimonas gwangyangensis TaxID=288022 RepID=UPI0003665445|nr:TonB-dependent receptor [Kordiimonas gwangyangensis]
MGQYTKCKSIALSTTILSAISGTAFAADAENVVFEEITVTATRRSESIQDIPYNISAVTGASLEKVGAQDMTDLSRMVSGIQFIDTGARSNGKLIMRGLSDGDLQAAENQGSGSTVSRYVGDTPLTADLKLFDIERVEVLRGPQGTLYGRGAMGGTVRYIPNAPKTDGFEASVDAELYGRKASKGISYELTGMVNVPVSDRVAIRAAANYLKDKGFVDYVNVLTNPGTSNETKVVKDANGEETLNLKISALVELSEKASITASYYLQDQDAEGRQAVNPEFTGDKYSSALRYEEPRTNKDEIANVTLNWDLDAVSLTSTTSYSNYTGRGQRDQTDLLVVDIYPGYANFPYFSSFTEEVTLGDEAWVHETRLVSNNEGPLNWIAGIYYEHLNDKGGHSKEFTPGYQDWAGIDTGYGELEYWSYGRDTFTEKAVFGELSYDVSERWNVTVGGRYFHQKVDVKESCDLIPIYWYWSGVDPLVPECSGSDYDGDTGVNTVKDQVFKINTSYDITDDVKVYATWAEGFRRGGVNFGLLLTDEEKGFGPDKVTNYEFGWHSTLADGRVQFNGALFYIDWTGIQVGTKSEVAAINITRNGGKATSKGAEIDTKWQVNDNFQLGGSFTYTDAKIGEGADAVGGVEGNKLQGVPQVSWNAYVDYNRNWMDGEMFANASIYHRGKIKTRLNSLAVFNNDDQQILPSFEVVKLTAGYKRDNWSVKLFADNLFNAYGQSGGRGAGRYGVQGSFVYVIAPRTFGLSFGYDF